MWTILYKSKEVPKTKQNNIKAHIDDGMANGKEPTNRAPDGKSWKTISNKIVCFWIVTQSIK
jgi:hypothetical protein